MFKKEYIKFQVTGFVIYKEDWHYIVKKSLFLVHRGFFVNLADITSVNIIGYSMSDVDLPYFQSVQLYSPDIKTWNVYYYDKEEQDSMKEQLLSIGVMEEKICMKDANEFWN